ncbi:MFS transporter [Nocardioides insulae]|uniref:MFS transporter n=1 Tax=Nocardioides insulae TaxID=394734 RepID=UPI00041239C2|nr:MFS transporter [Nocardioides insulae]
MSNAVHALATKKAIRSFIPLLLFAYFISYVDRMNIGLAKTQLEADVGISAAAYGLGAGIFFISYALLEIPSNLILHKVGPRLWIARIAITWGLLSSAMMFVNSETTFYILRFLLGAAEAGLYPALMYVVTVWFAQEDRARVVGYILVSSSLAGVVGGPIGGALMLMDGTLGLQGWQWLFFIEGIPAVIIGLLIWFKLPNNPHGAKFLTTEEADALVAAAAEPAKDEIKGSLWVGFRNPVVLMVALTYFTAAVIIYGGSFFGPAVIESMGVSNSLLVGLIAGGISCGAIVGVLIFPKLLKRIGSELPIIALYGVVNMAVAALFFMVSSPVLQLVLFFAMTVVTAGVLPMFWSIVMARVSGRMAAGVLAFVNTVSLLGGFVGPVLFGIAEEATGDVTSGMAVVGVCGAVSLILLGGLTLAIKRGRRAVVPEPRQDSPEAAALISPLEPEEH